MTLPALRPLERDELKSLLTILDAVEKQFASAPYSDAVGGIRWLNEARDVLEEVLPGGLFTYCESCELPIGNDEGSATGEDDGVTVCDDCMKQYAPVAA